MRKFAINLHFASIRKQKSVAKPTVKDLRRQCGFNKAMSSIISLSSLFCSLVAKILQARGLDISPKLRRAVAGVYQSLIGIIHVPMNSIFVSLHGLLPFQPSEWNV